ncbi:2'-5' RNA ligase family protein [Actinomycetospora cinnamomea]|uniref:2'-5' RNA ligase superfamily protein n=1 Tax=Actinomycetospora cinnamomea TaxID=663609 RepID=A0A2U1FIR1_9PSEU|nr:2'-5' RNA ligase family protein [Actinomycetospora cinnamomea]PVZ12058.1 2'-5' RNA ligase superfamily protein [Actinomycetospora cinnamomea]
MTDTDPLIVSALLDADSQAELDARRRRWFPPGRRIVGAHLTLFHALPGDRADEVAAALEDVTDRPAPSAGIGEPFALGHGVAHRIDAPELVRVHEEIARRFAADLTHQDRQRWRPHVTVQNKVDPETARATLAELAASHRPWTATVTGVGLWRYRGGPWEALGAFPFRDDRTRPPAG